MRIMRVHLLVVATVAATVGLLGAVAHWQVVQLTPLQRFLQLNQDDTQGHALAIAAKMDYALHSTERNAVVCVGDSSCTAGFLPQRYEDVTGCKAYNLGTIRMLGPRSCPIILRHYLQNHPAPVAVIVCFDPLWGLADEAGGDTRVGYVRLATLLQARFYDAFAPEQGTMSWPAYRDRVRWGLASWWQKPSTFPVPVEQERGYHEARGNVLLDAKPVPLAPVGKACREAMKELQGLTRERGIMLILRLMPVPTGMVADATTLQAWLDELVATGVVIAQPTILEAPLGCNGDQWHHLNRKGAEWLTRQVAAELTARDKSSHLVSLDKDKSH